MNSRTPNMFASDLGSLNPTLPVNTLEGKILKEFGGSVLGAYGYSISPSSSREALATTRSFEHAGGSEGVLDTSLPFGGMDFTSEALVAKQHHVNALFPTMIDASNFALAHARSSRRASRSRPRCSPRATTIR